MGCYEIYGMENKWTVKTSKLELNGFKKKKFFLDYFIYNNYTVK